MENYDIHEWRHAIAILQNDFPNEWCDIEQALENFRFYKSWVNTGGGRKSKVADSIDGSLYQLGWSEKQFKTRVMVDQTSMDSPTHKIDCYKNRIALEVEWNNKDPFF